jgi:hypothetical protein
MRKTTDPLPHKSQTGAWQFPGAAAFPLTTDLDFTRPFAIERRSVFCRSDPVVGKEQKFSRIATGIHRVPMRLAMGLAQRVNLNVDQLLHVVLMAMAGSIIVATSFSTKMLLLTNHQLSWLTAF